MKISPITNFIIFIFVVFFQFFVLPLSQTVYAATSPSLGQADGFVVLANTAVTDVPTSVITGNVGLSAGASITGLQCSEVTGTIYDGNTGYDGNGGGVACLVTNASLLTQAATDLVTAYNGLSGGDNATCTVDYGAIDKDLSGLSLAPGVYCAEGAGDFKLTGTLTLTGSGVWIFRSGSTLITSGTANIVGGDPCNIWWKVPSSATIGSSTSLKGNILASTSIGMVTGATLAGRALVQTGAVTLQSNTITKPSCTTTTTTTSSTSSSGSSTSAPATKSCPNLNCVTPIILESRRVDADSIFISWGPYAGINTFTIQYGIENGKWLYSTTVTGFSTTLNDLPPNQPIWVLISPTDGCSIGLCGEAKLVGGPRLPNTGHVSYQSNVSWYATAGIGVLIAIFFVFFEKKQRNLFKH